jgi:PhnB protein
MAKPIPDGYGSVTPYLVVSGASRAIEFYTRVFGAKELFRMDGPNGTVGHAEIQLGNSRVMLADEMPAMGAKAPTTIGGTPVHLLLYVPDVDQVVDRAVKAGATLTRAVENQFYGDRAGNLTDPFGHSWTIATHVEDVPPEEMKKRAAKMGGRSG